MSAPAPGPQRRPFDTDVPAEEDIESADIAERLDQDPEGQRNFTEDHPHDQQQNPDDHTDERESH